MNKRKLNRRTVFKTGFGLGMAIVFPVSAFAHRQKQAHSTIIWNDLSKSLEVTHRVHMHDAERALAVLGKIDRPDLSSLKARALLALHIEEQFGLNDLNGEALTLEILGAEIEGSHVYVYQEVGMAKKPEGLFITNKVLQDIYPDQMNHVNIELSGRVRSAVFASGDKAKKVLA